MSAKSRFAVLAVAAISLLAAASPASAGVLLASAPGCDNGDTTQRFLDWADPAQYFLAPDGAFDNGGEGWTLNGATADGLLDLDDPESAVSPTICVGIENPAIRFFVRQTGGGVVGYVRVGAYVEDNNGEVTYIPMGAVPASSSWQPSPQIVLSAALLALLPGEHTPVQLRLEAIGGDFQVDEVWIDPYGGH